MAELYNCKENHMISKTYLNETLNRLVKSADTTLFGKLFQISTILFVK